MRKAMCVVLGCAGIFVSGCTMVTSVTPVGEKPLILNDKDWKGTWFDGENLICFIKVKDKSKGVLRAALIKSERGADKDFLIKNFDIQVKEGCELIFGNILYEDMVDEEDLEKAAAKTYIWFMITKSRDKLLLYMPNSDLLKKLVKEKKLKGEAYKNGLIISESDKDFRKLIDLYGNSGELFNWKEPITLRRLMKK